MTYLCDMTPCPYTTMLRNQLETEVICDQCGLEFAIYGVFASCPDCGQLNALKVLLSSLETATKKLALSEDQSLEEDLRRDFLKDALTSSIGAFDAYGKALRAHRVMTGFSVRSNLFQDIEMLDAELCAAGIPGVEQLIGTSAWEDMKWFFQSRHVYSHNAGVVDTRFVAKQPTHASLLGRLLPLDPARVEKNIEELGRLARNLDSRIT